MNQHDLLSKIEDRGLQEGVIDCVDAIFKEGYDTVCLIPLKVHLSDKAVLVERIGRLCAHDKVSAMEFITAFETDPCRFLGSIVASTRQLLDSYGLPHLLSHREKIPDEMIRIRSAFSLDMEWKPGDPIAVCLVTGANLSGKEDMRYPFGLSDYVMLRTALIIGLNKTLQQFVEDGEIPPEIFEWVTPLSDEGAVQVFHADKKEETEKRVLH